MQPLKRDERKNSNYFAVLFCDIILVLQQSVSMYVHVFPLIIFFLIFNYVINRPLLGGNQLR